MPRVQESLTSAAYALFALEQPLSLGEIATGARTRTFPIVETHTPEWFAAAADNADLTEMAPELQVLPADLGQAEQVDVSGIDLIHVYAPELTAVEDMEEPPSVKETPPVPAPEKPRTSTQLGLLKELGNLDA